MINVPRVPVALTSVLESHPTTIHYRQPSIILMKHLLFYFLSARFSYYATLSVHRRRLSEKKIKQTKYAADPKRTVKRSAREDTSRVIDWHQVNPCSVSRMKFSIFRLKNFSLSLKKSINTFF